jgi:hypothetical protein
MKRLLVNLASFWLGGVTFIVTDWDSLGVCITDERFWIVMQWPYLVARYWIGIQ